MNPKHPEARLLIVDDEDDLRELYRDLLGRLTPHIEEARNGKIALEMCRQNKYDAILSDINMPEMNGLDFLEALRLSNINTPFVISTAYGDKTNAIRALRAGAYDFVEKPVKNSYLIDVMSAAIEVGQNLNALHKPLDEAYDSIEKEIDRQKKKK